MDYSIVNFIIEDDVVYKVEWVKLFKGWGLVFFKGGYICKLCYERLERGSSSMCLEVLRLKI